MPAQWILDEIAARGSFSASAPARAPTRVLIPPHQLFTFISQQYIEHRLYKIKFCSRKGKKFQIYIQIVNRDQTNKARGCRKIYKMYTLKLYFIFKTKPCAKNENFFNSPPRNKNLFACIYIFVSCRALKEFAASANYSLKPCVYWFFAATALFSRGKLFIFYATELHRKLWCLVLYDSSSKLSVNVMGIKSE